MVLMDTNELVAQGAGAERTHKTLIKKHKHQPYHIKGITIQEADIAGYEEKNSKESTNQEDVFDGAGYCENYVPSVDVEFVVPHASETQILQADCTKTEKYNYFDKIMITYGLDKKQQIA